MVHVVQRQLLSHASLALAQRGDPSSHRRHMLTDIKVKTLYQSEVTQGRETASKKA
jgi:hypothetical protein